MASHVSGSESRTASRVPGLRNSRADSRRRRVVGSDGSSATAVTSVPAIARRCTGQLLRRLLHAFDHSAYGMHLVSVRPSRHSLCGVVQNQMLLKYVSSLAWYVVQWFLSVVSVQAFVLAGASPN